MREKKRRRFGWDLRTRRPVIIIGEVAGVKLFAGNLNRPATPKRRRQVAEQLIKTCRERGVLSQQLALRLIGLGHEMLLRLAGR